MPRDAQVPECRECDWELVRVGSQYYCQYTPCSRFGLPVNELGDTPDEHEQRCEDEGVERERRQA
jgi:hypothetical protein